MIVIAGYTKTDAERRDANVDAFKAMVARARIADGCLDLSISADVLDPERINIFELWRDQAALDAWRQVADPPLIERRETHVHLYRAGPAEPPF